MITDDQITELCVDVLRRRHPEHLAKLADEKGLPRKRIERFATVDQIVGEGILLAEHDPPAVLLGIFGTTERPEQDKRGSLTFPWQLSVEVLVVGTDPVDTIKRRSWYTMAVIECLMQRVPRAGAPIDSLRVLDVDYINGSTTDAEPRTVGRASLQFSVLVRDTLNLHDLPPDDTDIPTGTPGGAPETPYEPPVAWPRVQEDGARVQIDREALRQPPDSED